MGAFVVAIGPPGADMDADKRPRTFFATDLRHPFPVATLAAMTYLGCVAVGNESWYVAELFTAPSEDVS